MEVSDTNQDNLKLPFCNIEIRDWRTTRPFRGPKLYVGKFLQQLKNEKAVQLQIFSIQIYFFKSYCFQVGSSNYAFQLEANQIFQLKFSNFVQNFRSKTETFQLQSLKSSN